MMTERERLFRGKNKQNNEWIYGNLLEYPDGDTSIAIENFKDNMLDNYLVFRKSVGQYTGLKDKNGKEIYEGDILKGIAIWLEKYKNGIVVFRDGSFGVIWKRGEVEMFNAFPSMCNVEYEIIGNIYDNPELIRSDADDN